MLLEANGTAGNFTEDRESRGIRSTGKTHWVKAICQTKAEICSEIILFLVLPRGLRISESGIRSRRVRLSVPPMRLSFCSCLAVCRVFCLCPSARP